MIENSLDMREPRQSYVSDFAVARSARAACREISYAITLIYRGDTAAAILELQKAMEELEELK